jgi:hypothetical protein
MSSAQPPPFQGAQPSGAPYAAPQPGGPQYTGPQYTGPQYSEPQHAGGQYPGGQYPGPPAGGTDPYARTGGSSAGGEQATAHFGADQYGTDQGRPDVSDLSVGTLLGDVTRDLSTLMRQELALAQAEVKQEVAKTAKGAGALTGAALAGYFVLLFLSIALWSALSNLMDAGWAGLIVAVIWGIAAAVLFVTGRGQLRRVHPKPERTVDTLSQVPEALRPGHQPNAGPTSGGHR